MKPLEVVEYIALAILLTLLPWSWQLAVKLFVLLFLITIVRVIASRHFGNPALSKLMRWSLVAMVVYYLYNALSLFWTDNLSSGWGFLEIRLPLLMLPLMLLFADTSYLTIPRQRTILYLFCTSLALKFLFVLLKCLLTSTPLNQFPIVDNVHYTYTSLYLLTALAFVISQSRSRLVHLQDADDYIAALRFPLSALFIAYILLSTSRTGVIGLAILFLYLLGSIVVKKHNLRLAVIILLCAIPLAVAIHYILPPSARRVTYTVQRLLNNPTSDARVGIYQCSLRAAIDNLPLGVGVGDGQETLDHYYSQANYDFLGLNSHNIYLDSFLTLGIPGLLILLAMLILPLIDGIRQRNPHLAIVTLCFLFVGLFESILSRQLGLMFYIPFLYLTAQPPKQKLKINN